MASVLHAVRRSRLVARGPLGYVQVFLNWRDEEGHSPPSSRCPRKPVSATDAGRMDAVSVWLVYYEPLRAITSPPQATMLSRLDVDEMRSRHMRFQWIRLGQLHAHERKLSQTEQRAKARPPFLPRAPVCSRVLPSPSISLFNFRQLRLMSGRAIPSSDW